MRQFTIKRGDTSPALLFELLPKDVVLSGATVRFNMRIRDTNTVVVNRASGAVEVGVGTPTVRYNWTQADTAKAGEYDAEFEVTYLDGKIETFPNDGFIPILINEDIG